MGEERKSCGRYTTEFCDIVDVEVQGEYDGCLYHWCRKHGVKWHRHPPGSRERAIAEEYVKQRERPA